MSSRYRGAALVSAAVIVLLFLIARTEARPASLLRDFNAFYCAGWTTAHHADPYRNEPLGTCERSAQRPAFLERGPSYLTVPAPLPGYALVPFAILSLLPYGPAAFIWTLIVLASFAFTVYCLRSLTTLSPATIVAALALSDAYIGLTLGQLAPVAVAAVAGAALALAQNKTTLAACAAALAMIEPNLGLPACISLALFRPRTVGWLALFGAAAAVASVALLGWPENVEYVTRVLGAHGLSEVVNVKQLSSAYLLHRLGITALTALRISEVWYGAMVLLGILSARRLTASGASPALIVLLPVALAMVGGPYVHIAQIAAVVPAALLLLDRQRKDMVLILTVMLLAIPWPQFATLGTSFPIVAAVATAVLATELLPGSIFWVAAPALLAFLLAAVPVMFMTPLADPAPALQAAYDPAALADTSWGAYVAAVGTQDVTSYDLARLPTWLGLVAFCLGSARLTKVLGGLAKGVAGPLA